MKKLILLALVLGLIFVGANPARTQTSEFRTIILSGTADLLVDSSLTRQLMDGRRLYINGVYAWYDNAANTNQIFVEVIRGQTSFVVQGSGRQFKFSEAMTSSGIKGITMVPNITTGADSTLYFVINATGSDSLFLAVNCKLVN